jgi:hypothetical protein
MALVTLPSRGIREVQWNLNDPSQVTRSELTGASKFLELPRARFTATVEVAPAVIADFLPWRAFAAAVKGRRNTFHLPAIKPGEQPTVGTSCAVNGAGQTGSALNLFGLLPVSSTVLKAGAVICADDRLYILTADLVSNAGGLGTAQLSPKIRFAHPDGANVFTREPFGTMRMVSDDTGWIDLIDNYQPFSFTCEEAF